MSSRNWNDRYDGLLTTLSLPWIGSTLIKSTKINLSDLTCRVFIMRPKGMGNMYVKETALEK